MDKMNIQNLIDKIYHLINEEVLSSNNIQFDSKYKENSDDTFTLTYLQ